MSDTANTAGGINVNLCGNADCLFRRLDVYQGSSVLEQVHQYGNLSNMLMNCQVSPVDYLLTYFTLHPRRKLVTYKDSHINK